MQGMAAPLRAAGGGQVCGQHAKINEIERSGHMPARAVAVGFAAGLPSQPACAHSRGGGGGGRQR